MTESQEARSGFGISTTNRTWRAASRPADLDIPAWQQEVSMNME
jgi:hypothetical protein